MRENKFTWRFTKTFWIANVSELFERAAFYGMFISLTLYLTRLIGFSDVEAGWIAGIFAALLYLVPPFAGAVADKWGFKKSLTFAFTCLTIGYGILGFFQSKISTIFALCFIINGGSFVKSVITATVAKTSDEINRARAFSIFYQMVNIGAFSGKLIAKPIRTTFGLEYINLFSAISCFIAVFLIFIFYKDIDIKGVGKSLKETAQGFLKVITNLRFITLILIVSGFWAIQHQMYATMPKYVLRMVGEEAAPEWYANVNPLVVLIFVIPITHLVRKMNPVSSIGIALLIIPFSAFIFSLSPLVEKFFPYGFFLHPITLMMILGIGLQGLAECFLSPRFLEYASKQAPSGETALYMGYSHLTGFFANIMGFGISGYLLELWCPEPSTLSPEIYNEWYNFIHHNGALPERFAHAHYIWYVFIAIGLSAFLALQIYKNVTERVNFKNKIANRSIKMIKKF